MRSLSPASRRRWFVAAALGLAALFCAPGTSVVHADESTTKEAIRELRETTQLNWSLPRGRLRLLGSCAYRRYEDFNNNLWDCHGLGYMVVPTFMTQAGTQGGPDDLTTNEQVATTLAWRMFESKRAGLLLFGVNHLHVGQVSSTGGLAFTQSLGSNFFLSDSVADVDIFKFLGLRYTLPGDRVTLFLGHSLAAEVDAGGRFASDDTTSFISQPLSTNPVRQMPGGGFGAGANIQFSDRWEMQVHVADARGDGKLSSPATVFETGEVTAAGSLELTAPFPRKGEGKYRASVYWVSETQAGTPAVQPEGWGLTLHADQSFGNWSVFAKAGFAEGRVGLLDRFVNGGVVWEKPFGCSEDWLGLGFGAVDPTSPATNVEYVIEAFWRVQLTPFIQLSPDVQLILNPSRATNSDVEAVFTLRLRMHF